MQSVIKTFKVLETFSLNKPELTFTEIVNASGYGRTNTHKILKTLVSLNCLSQSHNGAPYRLGPKLFELGSQYLGQLNLRRIAMPYLLKLAEEFEDSVFLCIEDQGEALCLERVDGPSDLKTTVLQRGGRLPLHAGAATLAILTGMNDEQIASIMRLKGFKQFTQNTVKNLDELMEKVKKTAKQGYAESWEDVTIGVASFGAPVKDFSKKVIGSISIGGIILRYKGKRKRYFIDLVKKAAFAISKDLGYEPAKGRSYRKMP